MSVKMSKSCSSKERDDRVNNNDSSQAVSPSVFYSSRLGNTYTTSKNNSFKDCELKHKVESSTEEISEKGKKPDKSVPDVLDKEEGKEIMSNHCSEKYKCQWTLCCCDCNSESDLAEHIRIKHLDSQQDSKFVCLWSGCKVYRRVSCSRAWLERHVLLVHARVKPWACIIGDCSSRFSSQAALERHVNSHFSTSCGSSGASSCSSSSSMLSSPSPSKSRRTTNHQPYVVRKPDLMDGEIMQRIKLAIHQTETAGSVEMMGDGRSVHFSSFIAARLTRPSMPARVLLRWKPVNILPDEWINESDVCLNKSRLVPLRQLGNLLHPSLYSSLRLRSQRRK